MSQTHDDDKLKEAGGMPSALPAGVELIEPGAIIDGRYQIISSLGAGGMCRVYLANHLTLQRRVALKVLHERLLFDADALKRFKREAVAVSTLQHPNIVKVFGFGFAGRAPFLAMEFIEGQSQGKQELPLCAGNFDF